MNNPDQWSQLSWLYPGSRCIGRRNTVGQNNGALLNWTSTNFLFGNNTHQFRSDLESCWIAKLGLYCDRILSRWSQIDRSMPCYRHELPDLYFNRRGRDLGGQHRPRRREMDGIRRSGFIG